MLDDIERTCGIGDVREACSAVLRDEACLVLKKINPDEWRESYKRSFGSYPSKETFMQNVGRAIKDVEGLVTFGKVVSSITPADYETFVGKAREVLRILRDYRNSIPSYF